MTELAQNLEKPQISFAEYMALQRAEIQKAMQDIEFVKQVQSKFNLDSKTIPTHNQFVETWLTEHSQEFRKKMEDQYKIVQH